MKVAMCYGHNHRDGKRLPADAFAPNDDRINGLSEFCRECTGDQPTKTKKDTTTMKRTCTKCNTEKADDGFYHPTHNICKRCTLDRQKAAKLAKAGKTDHAPTAPRIVRPAASAPTKVELPAKTKAEHVLDILILCGKVTRNQVDAAYRLLEDQ